MNFIYKTILLLGLGLTSALGSPVPSIVGTWQYDGFLYDGHRYPNPNPSLELFFIFNSDGVSKLYWQRRNETAFCERLAKYTQSDNILWQKVIWINPNNSSECAKDVDMNLGQESTTTISIDKSELNFLFDLNGKAFLYILKRIESAN